MNGKYRRNVESLRVGLTLFNNRSSHTTLLPLVHIAKWHEPFSMIFLELRRRNNSNDQVVGREDLRCAREDFSFCNNFFIVTWKSL